MKHQIEPSWIRAQQPLGLATVTLWVVLGSCASPGAETAPAAPAIAPVGAAQPMSLERSTPSTPPVRSAPAAPTASSDYVLGASDQIEVAVFGAESFSGAHRVGEGGTISVPLLGAVPVEGLTVREAEDTLESRLRATYMRDPHVTVQVTEMRSHGVSVVGAVNRPGVYQVGSTTTLLEVLALAEGLAPDAGSTVYVARGGGPAPAVATFASADPDSMAASGEVVRVDLGTLLESGSAAENVVIVPGDIVQVRPAGLIYVVGQVNRPGGFSIPPGRPMTVLQALAMAQGLGNTAAAGRSVIVREGEGGDQEELPVDLGAILKGDEPPPVMVARDVLFVPENGAKSFGLGVINAMMRMVTLRGLVY